MITGRIYMVRSFFSQLWTNIKRSPVITVLVFIQIVLTAYCLFNILWTFSEYDLNNLRVQNVYGEKSIYCVARKRGISSEELMRATGALWGREGNDDSDYQNFYAKVRALVDENYGIDTALFVNSPVYLENGVADAYSVDKDYIDVYGLTLESGRFFTDDEYADFDYSHIPVVLGADYKSVFSLGDTFAASIFQSEKKMTYEVVGFLTAKQFFVEAGSGEANYFDRIMLVPYVYKTEDEWLEWLSEPSNLEYRPPVKGMVAVYYLPSLGIMSFSRTFLVDKGNEELAESVISTALAESGTDAFFEPRLPGHKEEQTADYYRENNTMFAILVSIMVFFSLLAIVFSAINNTTNNIRSYAIQTLAGATRRSNIIFAAIETLILCALGFTAGFFMMYSRILEWDYLSHPATEEMIRKGAIISVAFIVAACALTLVFVWLKMRKYSVAELIRGNEVKKDGKAPLYKVLTFAMFTLAGVSVTFLTSYIWQTENIDKYQNNYLQSGSEYIYLQPLPVKEPPEVTLDYDIEGLENYSMDMLVNQQYDTESNPKIRAWYSKNGFNIPEITDGRFFDIFCNTGC